MPAPKHIAPYPKIALPTAKGLVFYSVHDILYFEVKNTLTMLHCADKETSVYRSLASLEAQLSKHGFVLVRRDILINTHNIQAILKDHTITMLDGKIIYPSRGKIRAFEAYIRQHFCS